MPVTLDQIVNLAKRRGFFFPSAELYGGAGSIIDLGPYGVEMMNAIKQLWWKRFIQGRADMVGIDSAILTPEPVLKASGHVDSFTDPLIECGNCHIRLRADHYLDETSREIWLARWLAEAAQARDGQPTNADREAAGEAAKAFFEDDGTPRVPTTHGDLVCPNPKCREKAYGEPRLFNMMFKTQMGAVANEGSVAYLRPETAQGIFTNFKYVQSVSRKKPPFGIGQIGKAFRNEITTGNSLFRVREFEQAEIEYFVKPGEDEPIHEQWIEEMERFITDDLGVRTENMRRYEHPAASLSHYSKRTVDLEYNYPFGGYGELMGVANRTDYDLRQHQEHSGQDLTYFDEQTKERYLPFVIEPSMGLGRILLTILIDSYEECPGGRDGKGTETETVLHLKPALAPVQVAVLPLMKKDGLAEKAQEIAQNLRLRFRVQYDESGAIGRRYRRQDEIGTPYSVTVDYQTMQDGTVTVRDRDTMEQRRVPSETLGTELQV